MGSFLFADKKGVHVHLCFLPLLRDLTHTVTYSWGGAVLAHTYRELCEPAWIVDAVLAVVLHRYRYVIFFFITYTFIYTTHH